MIRSMTAFAKLNEQGDWGSATWEIRTVNHRYLDVSMRLPEAMRELEMPVRELASRYLKRGKVDCQLRFQPGVAVAADIRLNEKLVAQLGSVCQEISGILPATGSVDPIKLLHWPGILQITETDMKPVHKKILKALEATLQSLVSVREREGEKLQAVLLDRIAKLQAQVKQIKLRTPVLLDEQRAKVLSRFEELSVEVDPQRVEQELVFMTQKMDVAEELDRLDTHLVEVKRILQYDQLVGRRLDFLMQELHRETNTLGSKSADIELTQAMLEMKVLIEQMREQVQNLE